MKLIIEKEELISSLQKVNNLIGKKIDIPILNNILIKVEKNSLSLTASNLEIEIIAKISLKYSISTGQTTIPGRKLLDICRSFPEKSKIHLFLKNKKIIITCKKIFFSLITIPSQDFPIFPSSNKTTTVNFFIQESKLKNIIKSTYFCMASSDIRYYLNGMFIKIYKNTILSICTDGYRIAIHTNFINEEIIETSIIIPRKSIIELYKILKNSNELIKVSTDNKNICFQTTELNFSSKLIDGSFPKCTNLFSINFKKIIQVNTLIFKNAISRISILSNEQFRGITLYICHQTIKITSENQEDEKAEETIDIVSQNNSETIKISINVQYILEVLNVIQGDTILLKFNDSLSNIQIEDDHNMVSKYLIMSLKL